MVKEHVTHLGVVNAKEYKLARKLTYEAGKTAMKKATSRVSGGISSINIILKAQAVNTIVSGVNNHRFRVFPPTVPEMEEMWKIARATLWTTINIEGREVTRHKISHDKVIQSLENGGLALIHPRQAEITWLVSSMARIYRHS